MSPFVKLGSLSLFLYFSTFLGSFFTIIMACSHQFTVVQSFQFPFDGDVFAVFDAILVLIICLNSNLSLKIQNIVHLLLLGLATFFRIWSMNLRVEEILERTIFLHCFFWNHYNTGFFSICTS